MRLRSMVMLGALSVLWLASSALAQVTLKPKLEPGTRYKTQEKTKVSQSLKLNGADLGTNAENKTVVETSYRERDDEGNLPVDAKIESLVADLSLPGGIKLHFDSAKPDEKAENAQYEIVLDIFRKLSGLTLSHKINRELKVVSVTGVQEGTQLNEEELKSEYQEALDFFPKEPVKPGDTWERTVEKGFGSGQFMTFQRKYEYQGRAPQFPTVKDSKMLDKITATDSSVVYSVKPGRGLPVTVNKSDLKVAESKHVYWFDPEAGRIVAGESEVKIKGALSLALMGTNLDGDLDLTMSTQAEEIE